MSVCHLYTWMTAWLAINLLGHAFFPLNFWHFSSGSGIVLNQFFLYNYRFSPFFESEWQFSKNIHGLFTPLLTALGRIITGKDHHSSDTLMWTRIFEGFNHASLFSFLEIIDDLANLVENTDEKLRTETRRVNMVDRKSTSCGKREL